MIAIASKRKKKETLLKEFPGAILADVTSKATDGLRRLSPFYPHYDIQSPWSASRILAILAYPYLHRAMGVNVDATTLIKLMDIGTPTNISQNQ